MGRRDNPVQHGEMLITIAVVGIEKDDDDDDDDEAFVYTLRDFKNVNG